MKSSVRKWSLFVLRWGIAIVGIWWVLSNISFRDRVTVLGPTSRPVEATLLSRPGPGLYHITDPTTGGVRELRDTDLVNPLPGKAEPITLGDGRKTRLLALHLSPDLKRVDRLLIEAADGSGQWVAPAQAPGHALKVPRPLVEKGIVTLVSEARPEWLAAAVLIFPVVFVITALRWHELLRAVQVPMALGRSFVLNMVGCFYSTFMPGSTGGDVLKAYYAALNTPDRKTYAVMTVVIDRIIGLLALVILGGVMAGIEYFRSTNRADPAVVACRQVAFGAVVIVAAVLGFLLIFGIPGVRIALGLDGVLKRLPFQRQVQRTLDVLRIYRRRPGLMLGALLVTFPVHITVVVSAMFIGKAFALPIPAPYYFVAIPVIVLAGAIPISPQGAGVMEFFAIQLTKQHGVTIGQAFALTLCIRLVQMLWNLTGGFFVFRGGYHAPSEKEQQELEQQEEAESLTEQPTQEVR